MPGCALTIFWTPRRPTSRFPPSIWRG